MYLFGMLLAKMADPIFVGTIFAIVLLLSRSKWSIPLATILGASISETLLVLIQVDRAWGEGILLSLLAGIIVSTISFCCIKCVTKTTHESETKNRSFRRKFLFSGVFLAGYFLLFTSLMIIFPADSPQTNISEKSSEKSPYLLALQKVSTEDLTDPCLYSEISENNSKYLDVVVRENHDPSIG
ncbi:MAG: hypothetical protein ACQEW7_14880, partial [Pseudomonadota bacterium]